MMGKTLKIMALMLLAFIPVQIKCTDEPLKFYVEIKQVQDVWNGILNAQKEAVILAFEKVESDGERLAYNAAEDAAGILQIRPVMVKEANRIIGSDRYNLSDRFDPTKSREIFWIVQEHHNGKSFNVDKLAHYWNCGTTSKSMLKKTLDYREKVRRAFEEKVTNRY